MKLYKRLLSALLAFVMVLGMMPMSVLATETEEIPEASVLEETQAPEALPEETEVNEETEAPEEIPEETEAPEEIPEATEAPEEIPEETEAPEEIPGEPEVSEESQEIPGLGARAGKTYSGKYGSNVTWELNTATRTLVISGSGVMDDNWGYAPWDDHYEYVETVIIQEGITEIGYNVFSYDEYIVHVTLPESLTLIAENAFDGCYALESINLPESITEIAAYAFYGCKSLTSVELPSGLKVLGDDAFGESGLEEIFIPKTVRNWDIYSSPFSYCSDLKTVTFENGTTVIPANFLQYCEGVETVVLPDTITEIHNEAFSGCSSLTQIQLPEELVVLGSGAFAYSGLEEITLPDTLRTVEDYLFDGCANLHTVNLPDSITTISHYAFRDCGSLRGFVLPPRLKTLGCEAFARSGLQEIFLHKYIEEFNVDVFEECENLTTAELEEGLTYVADSLFYNCNGLETVILPDTILEIRNYAFSYCSALENIDLPDNITHIQYNAFYGCEALKEIQLPAKLKFLGGNCFAGTGITSITIPKYVEDLGGSPFGEESDLTTLAFADGLKKIPNYIAQYTESLTTVLIPESVTEIGAAAFEGCIALESIVLPSKLEKIGNYAFDTCDTLAGIDFPDTVIEIGEGAFYDCRLITQVTLPPALERLGGEAFTGTHIKEITIPKTVSHDYEDSWYYYDWSPFEGCETLQKVTFEDGMTRIPDYILDECVSVKEVVIPDSVKVIGGYAFSNTELLKTVALPTGLESIENGAFEYSDIESLVLPESLTYIGQYAFAWCDYLEEIKFLGKAPTMEEDIFCDTTTTAYHPNIPTSWTKEVCHDYYGDVTWTPYGHEHTEKAVAGYPATCTKPGLTDGAVCAECGEPLVNQEVIPALGHEEVIDEGKEPNCEEDGLTEGSHCQRCNEVIVEQEVIPAYGHYEIIEYGKEPSCLEDGYTDKVYCDNCGKILEDSKVLPALGHLPGEPVEENYKAPDIGVDGSYDLVVYCDRCSAELSRKPVIIPALKHTPGEAVEEYYVSETCETDGGYDMVVYCEECGQELSREHFVIPATGHAPCEAVEEYYVSETCETDGSYDMVVYCDNCGKELSRETVVIPAPGHEEIVEPGMEPSCEEPGYTEEITCAVCGRILQAGEIIPAMGHNVIVVPAVKPTCEDTGLTEGSYCDRCAEVYQEQEIVPALGHKEVIDAKVEPGCEEPGLTEGKHCERCGKILLPQEVIPAPGHEEVVEPGTEPGCEEPGWTEEITCAVCGEILKIAEEIPALGHDVVIDEAVEPDCENTGLTEGKHCDRCEEIFAEQEEIPALGHNEVAGIGVDATCECSGLTEGSYCDRCDLILVPQEEILPLGHDYVNGVCTRCGDEQYNKCGDDLYWSFDETTGTLTITGTGAMYDFELYATPWYDYNEQILSVVIDEGATTIGSTAFAYSSALREVVLPETLTMIGNGAFGHCDQLQAMILPDSVMVLGEGALSWCDSLAYVVLPENLTTLSAGVLQALPPIQLEIPAGVTSVEAYALAWCNDLEVTFLGSAPAMDEESFNFALNVTAYYPAADRSWTEEVRQNYGGEITWVPYGEVPELAIITDNGLDYILSGKKLQLAALNEDGSEADVVWSILEGEGYASVSSLGVVTAKTVKEVQTVLVQAVSRDTGAEATLALRILPKGSTLEIFCYDSLLEDTLLVDLYHWSELELTALLNGEAVPVTWTAKNADVDDNGLVSLSDVGTVTVTAQDPYGITGTVKLDIYYLDPAAKLAASADIPTYGLQQEESVQMTVSGSNPIDPSWLEFRCSDEDVVTVDSDGIITGMMPGTAKITAAIIGDPEGREVTLTVKVIPMQAASLDILYEGESVEEVRFDAAELGGESDTFTLEPLALTLNGSEIPQNAKSIKWTCSNSKLATIKTNSDGSATVTIKAGAESACEITAQTTDLAKATDTITLAIVDRSPKLGSNSVTLNPAQESGADLVLVSSYDNDITDVYIDSDVLEAAYDSEAGLLNVYALEEIRNGTIKTTLTVTCVDGYDYYFDLKVSVKNSIPSVTVKQLQKLDLFYTDSEAELSVTAKDAQVDWNATELIDTQDFQLENGILTFTDTLIEGMQDNPRYRPDTRATLLVYLEDYLYPVEKSVTIGTSTSRMTLSTDPGSGIINTAMSSDYRVYFSVLNKSEKEVLPLKYEDVTCDESYNVDENGEISITFEEAKKGTVTLQIQKENWMKAIEVKHKVSVEEKLPTVKLSATTLKLSSLFKNQTAIATVALNQGNMNIVHFSNGDVFETTAKEGSDAAKEAAKISVTYDGGQIYARIKAGKTPKAGTYTYTAVPYVLNRDGENIALRDVTIKVNVSATAPKIKLGASTVKLNTLLMGDEVAKIPVTLNDNTGYGAYIHTFEGMDKYEEVQMRYEDGMLYVSLLGGGEDKYSYTLTPVVRDEVGSEAKLPTVKLTVQSFHSKNIGISQSGKGKLDTLDPASSIVYTISKLTNMQGSVESVELVGGEDVFEISELGVDAKGKQCFTLKLKAGAQVRVNENYELRFRYGICGIILETPVQKVKVSQSNVKASAPAITFFQSQSQPMYVGVTANAPIDKVIINKDKTAKELVQALALTEDRIIDVGNVESVGMNLSIPRPGGLTPGKTYKLVLDVIPVGNAENAKITQITVNVKVGK